MDGQFIANDAGPSADELGTGPIYTWANFDEIGDSTDPNYKSTDGSVTYTTTTDEVSDMQDVARALYIGQTNAVEWYAPMRAIADMLIAVKDFGPKFGLNFLHADKVPEMPQVDFLTENGPMIGRTDDQPPEITIIKGYNHLDVLMAAANCPSRRPNEVIDPVLDFVLKKS